VTASLKLYAILAALVVAAGSYLGWRAHERSVGALEVRMAQADSAHKVDSLASVRAIDSLAKANLRLDSLVAGAEGKARTYRVATVTTDTARAHLASARDSLAQAIADSQATLAELRAAGERMIRASDSTEAAHAKERQDADDALAAAKRAYTFAVDSVRKDANRAIQAAVRRATDAETQTKLAKRLIPNDFVGWLKLGGTVLVSVEGGRMSAGKFP
jgi:hypothetical protein